MINTKDQEELFELISRHIKIDIECYAMGGTAMMFYGYKNSTKDIDLIFKSKEEFDEFIQAIKELGYKQMSAKEIYPENKSRKNPLMFTRGDERFDLFLNDVFGFKFDKEAISSFKQRHDFIGKKELIIKVMPIEYLILLKAITNRDRDFEDIQEIVRKEQDIDWGFIIDQGIKQKKNNKWILIDLEETLQKLKKITFIPSKYFKKIYGS